MEPGSKREICGENGGAVQKRKSCKEGVGDNRGKMGKTQTCGSRSDGKEEDKDERKRSLITEIGGIEDAQEVRKA